MFTPPPRPLPDLCLEAGFTGMTEQLRRRSFSFEDPEHYWRWQMSHGQRTAVSSRSGEVRENRAGDGRRALSELEDLPADPRLVQQLRQRGGHVVT